MSLLYNAICTSLQLCTWVVWFKSRTRSAILLYWRAKSCTVSRESAEVYYKILSFSLNHEASKASILRDFVEEAKKQRGSCCQRATHWNSSQAGEGFWWLSTVFFKSKIFKQALSLTIKHKEYSLFIQHLKVIVPAQIWVLSNFFMLKDATLDRGSVAH